MVTPKKKKKTVTMGIAHLKATFNNTLVSFSDTQGNVIASSSSGANGFKGAKKATPYAAMMTVNTAAKKAQDDHDLKVISAIEVKGAGAQRESAMRAIMQAFIVSSIQDVSPIAHNGVKPPKRRRV